MFEATLSQVVTFRKIIDSLKDLVSEVNIEATPQGRYTKKLFKFLYCILILYLTILRIIFASYGFRPCKFSSFTIK